MQSHIFHKCSSLFIGDPKKRQKSQLYKIDWRQLSYYYFKVMQLSAATLDIIQQMAEHGNPNSVSDAGVGALCARTAVLGAWLNVKINCSGYDDANFVSETLNKCESIVNAANKHETAILEIVHQKISNPS